VKVHNITAETVKHGIIILHVLYHTFGEKSASLTNFIT